MTNNKFTIIFPIIADAITQICTHKIWANRDEIAQYILDNLAKYNAASPPVFDASIDTHQGVANFVDWFSAWFTQQNEAVLPYIATFERIKLNVPTEKQAQREVWAYRPFTGWLPNFSTQEMKLTQICLNGYKSIGAKDTTIELGDITILLGANGVGKSNLISFFNLLYHIVNGSLQTHVAAEGYADTFLYLGQKQTQSIHAHLTFEHEESVCTYQLSLMHGAGDKLLIQKETVTYQQNHTELSFTAPISTAERESNLLSMARQGKPESAITQLLGMVFRLLDNCKVYHFQDTSVHAKVRQQGYIEDNRLLHADANNLAAFLYRLKENSHTYSDYQKIVRYITMAMPQFGDFDLFPNGQNQRYISLNWHEANHLNYLFGSHQISDGSLRFMCLATLLLQPAHLLPRIIVLDEPELGLHPSAIAYLNAMVFTASQHAQIIIATQSPRLVDEAEVNSIVVVERVDNASVFVRKREEDLADWLEEYSLSELWEKNVIGGLPW
jgi:predicted ATPase